MATDYLTPAEARAYPRVATAPDQDRLHTSRRNFLAAGVITPLALSGPIVAATGRRSAWELAVARIDQAKARYELFYSSQVRPVLDAFYRGDATYEATSKAEEAAGEYASATAEAVNAMTLVPAPTLAALHYKIRTAHADNVFDGSADADVSIEAIIADLARMGRLA